ncbi:MAG: hypothetical protein AAFV47_06050 [Pseudomonadota bacterium]
MSVFVKASAALVAIFVVLVALQFSAKISALESEIAELERQQGELHTPFEVVQQDIFSLYMQIGELRESVQQSANTAPLPPPAQGYESYRPQQRPVELVAQPVYPTTDLTPDPLRADGTTNRQRHSDIQQRTGSFAPFLTEEGDD